MATAIETEAAGTRASSPEIAPPRPSDRVVLKNISWSLYQTLRLSRENYHVRMTYDRGALELMSPSRDHESYKIFFGHLIEAVAEGLAIRVRPAGPTTWSRPESARGLEADECFYFAAEKREVIRTLSLAGTLNVTQERGPFPDLALEVDISPSQIDRRAIYALLGVSEVWLYDGETLRFDRLAPDGSYQAAAESLYLPILPGDVSRWLDAWARLDLMEWTPQVRGWARDELVARRPQRP